MDKKGQLHRLPDGQRKLLDRVTQGDEAELKLKFNDHATSVPGKRQPRKSPDGLVLTRPL